MEEYQMKTKIPAAFFEPRAPERLINAVITRARAVTMGLQAQKQLETAPGEEMGSLAARVMIGKLAAVSELPENANPEQLAEQLYQEPSFRYALRGGNVAHRIENGDLLRQITEPMPEAKQDPPRTGSTQKRRPSTIIQNFNTDEAQDVFSKMVLLEMIKKGREVDQMLMYSM